MGSRVTAEGGFQQGSLPCTYLGIPIFNGRKKTSLFMFLRDKISQRIHCLSHKHLSFGGRLTLARSVLEAIPVHIFQVLEPTKGVIRMMEQVLARFIWGSCNTTSKTHWIKWKDVCRPTLEGGLGLRSMADTVEAYSYKLWWRFRERKSLWAEYLYKKYWSISSSLNIYRSSRFSPTWRRMFKAGLKCQSLIRWMLGDGKVSFWEDYWLKDQPIISLISRAGVPDFVRVEDFWAESGWREEALVELLNDWGVPGEVREAILRVPIKAAEKDIARWTLTPQGEFYVASAWDLIRNRGDLVEVYDFIWGKNISPSVSIFLWRLLANRVPVDAKIQWRGVSLASKCRCCISPKEETRLHLFVNGEAAVGVWSFFSKWFPKVPDFVREGHSIEGRLKWWQRHMASKQKHHICILIPCLIFWYIWSERNGCVHRDKKFKVERVCKRIEWQLRNLVLAGQIGPDQWGGCEPRVDFMVDQPRQCRPRRVERVQRRPPEWPWLKMNSDGAFVEATGKAGGGRILRNHLGESLEAFITPVNVSSSLEAELEAMLEGIVMAKKHGNYIWIESDAEVLCLLLSKDQCGPAGIRHTMARIRLELREVQWKISHIRREGNKVADFLASLGKISESLVRFEENEIPPEQKCWPDLINWACLVLDFDFEFFVRFW